MLPSLLSITFLSCPEWSRPMIMYMTIFRFPSIIVPTWEHCCCPYIHLNSVVTMDDLYPLRGRTGTTDLPEVPTLIKLFLSLYGANKIWTNP